MRRIRLVSCVLGTILWASCPAAEGVPEDVVIEDTLAIDTTEPDSDVIAELVTFDILPPDAEPKTNEDLLDFDTEHLGAVFGAPCTGNTDCESGWCVEGVTGQVCTSECVEGCPEGYDCRSIVTGGDVVFLCIPRVLKLCTPCIEDFQCGDGSCLELDGQKRCAPPCDGLCPEGYTCSEVEGGSSSSAGSTIPAPRYCLPRSGSCECSPPLIGAARTCSTQALAGTCFGVERCDPDRGWVGCTAPRAAAETCNYEDDDCDGEVDEDFKSEGLYLDSQACGTCNTDCDTLITHAAEATCAVVEGYARCQVVSCADGYVRLNDFVCIPEADNACTPCTSPAECLGRGSACSELSDGTFCTRACDERPCPDGFACTQTPDGPQCLPSSGSCTCDGDTTLARSCVVTHVPDDPTAPSATCRGYERCTASGWGECELPTEQCDGVDNDCDGEVDGPFKVGDRYAAIEHCGACGVSCLALARPNAEVICAIDGPSPTCGYRCVAPAVDVNGSGDDGCECVPIDGPDLAGDSIDSDCDGVDGEVDNAIFVSREGRDEQNGTRFSPVASLEVGLQRAAALGLRDVYVATGVYSGSIALVDGVGLFGGYAPDFGDHDVLLYETALIGEVPTAQRPATVIAVAVGFGDPTILDGFTIFGTNAANTLDQSSYAILLEEVGPQTRISHNRIFAGPGGRGQSGARGNDGLSGADGSAGLDARNTGGCPPAPGSAGGLGGARMCGASKVSGGDGGRADCPIFTEAPAAENNGAKGHGTAAGEGGLAGWDLLICAGADRTCNLTVNCLTCYLPGERTTASAGQPGPHGVHGTGGAPAPTGLVQGGRWVGLAGTAGGTGLPGSGGGGGGAGGGVEVAGHMCGSSAVSDDDLGGSGGGGGSGGCAGRGGQGGTSGGGSFGIFVVASTGALPAIFGNTIHGGRGGDGGHGGPGGVGGVGGQGGAGGQPGDISGGDLKRCAAGGAAGGPGGDGGHGGGGGGGAGGVAFGLYYGRIGVDDAASPPEDWRSLNTFATPGIGGAGGLGGVSLAPTRGGANGPTGASGDVNSPGRRSRPSE